MLPLVGLLSACAPQPLPSSAPMTWTMYQNSLTHNAIVRSDFPAVSFDRNMRSKINGGLAYDGTSLFAVNFNSDVIAIDPRTGHARWIAKGDDVLMSTPIVADGLVFVGSGTNRILWEKPGSAAWGRPAGNHWYAFNADDGRLVWSHHEVGEAMPTAAYADGRLLYATGDNVATELDARTGATIWQAPLPGVVTMAAGMVHDGRFYVVTTQGKPEYQSPHRNHTIALDVKTGKVVWSAPYGNADCTPTIAQGMVFVEGVNDGPVGAREAMGTNEVVALDERTGTLRWRYVGPSGFFTAVGSNERGITGTYDGGVLYQSLPTVSVMAAFRASDGRVLWTAHTSAPVKMSPIVYDGSVYAGDTAGMFYRWDARTGTVQSAIPFDRPYTTSPPIVVGKTLFVANTEYLRAIPLARFTSKT